MIVNSPPTDGNLMVMCDFDGTITTMVTTEFVLQRFALGDWRKFEQQFYKHEISLQECLERQFSLVLCSAPEIIAAVEKSVSIRANFDGLVSYCKSHDFPLMIVSAGLDFVVMGMLNKGGWLRSLKVSTPKSKFTPSGIKFEFPDLIDGSSRNFKEDLVVYHKKQGMKVVYIGDGTQDLPPAEQADIVFSIRGSKLSRLCSEKGVAHYDIDDFAEVVFTLDEISARNSRRLKSS